MNDNARPVPSTETDPAKPSARLPWFTADELPSPPPEMRRPPEKVAEPGLFDLVTEDESTSSTKNSG